MRMPMRIWLLDLYFSNIAGFSSTASRLSDRRIEQIQTYRPFLQFNFFERFPKHKPLETSVNETDTPLLARRLHFANLLRVELLPLLDAMLQKNRKEL